MTERRYRILVSAACERDIRRVRKRRPEVHEALLSARETLEGDPLNRSRRADIRKLEGVSPGRGQFCLRISDFRLWYDVEGDEVHLHTFRPRHVSYRD